jgi:hypothetical protein
MNKVIRYRIVVHMSEFRKTSSKANLNKPFDVLLINLEFLNCRLSYKEKLSFIVKKM